MVSFFHLFFSYKFLFFHYVIHSFIYEKSFSTFYLVLHTNITYTSRCSFYSQLCIFSFCPFFTRSFYFLKGRHSLKGYENLWRSILVVSLIFSAQDTHTKTMRGNKKPMGLRVFSSAIFFCFKNDDESSFFGKKFTCKCLLKHKIYIFFLSFLYVTWVLALFYSIFR